MMCSTSISMHLLRGVSALALIIAASFFHSTPLLVLPLLAGAFLLLRGCPMCWLFGLLDKLHRRATRAEAGHE